MSISLSDVESRPPAGPPTELDMIAARVRICKDCVLHRARKRAVPGAGTTWEEIMFIGEAPGFHENEQGLPFVGAAGKFLDELLTEAGLRRETVFITNVVKCRPPGNRDPNEDEILACNKHLLEQIEAISPKVIVTLGRFSMSRFLVDKKAKISKLHGRPFVYNNWIVVLMYHPAAALHRPSLRQVLVDDFRRLPRILAGKIPAPPMPGSIEETQMKML